MNNESKLTINVFYSQTETELNEKLADCMNHLIQAGADKLESERDVQLKATIASLMRTFPGKSLSFAAPVTRTDFVLISGYRRQRTSGRSLQTIAEQIRHCCHDDSRTKYRFNHCR